MPQLSVHRANTPLRVYADELGQPHCVVCHRGLAVPDMAVLLEVDMLPTYVPLCRPCGNSLLSDSLMSILRALVDNDL